MSIDAMRWAQRVTETGQLNTGQAFVLMLLGDFADEQWSCWPSQELLARRSAQTVRSVERHIQRLRELGLVSTQSLYGSGRGRIGLRYHLQEDALAVLEASVDGPESRMIPRPDNLSGKSEIREITRPDNLSGESEIRMIPRPDNLSGESTHPTISTDSPDNRASAQYKDRARTNPQEPPSVRPSVRLSGAVRASSQTDGPTTDRPMTDAGEAEADPVVHRGVVLAELLARVPAAAELPQSQVLAIVDVVLARASGPVRKPTAFVARSMASEFEELVAVTRPRPVAVSLPAGAQAASEGVRQGRVAEPCQNPDVHVPAYGAGVLVDCPHCRVERRSLPRHLAEAGG